MKRPQFGLRLILLLTALAAVWLAWFRVKQKQRKLDYESATFDLRRDQDLLKIRRKAIEAEFKGNDPGTRNIRDGYLNMLDGEAKDIQKKLDAIKE